MSRLRIKGAVGGALCVTLLVACAASAARQSRPTGQAIDALGGLPDAGPCINIISGSAADPSLLYAVGVSGGVFVSHDAGASWVLEDTPDIWKIYDEYTAALYGARRYRIGEKALQVSLDSGATWEDKPYPAGITRPLCLAVDPRNNGRIGIALRNVYLSEDGGGSWKDIGPVRGEYVDQIAFDPFDAERMYADNRMAGFATSDDGGRSWAATADPLLTTHARMIQNFFVSNVVSGLVIVATQDGIFRSTDGGRGFSAVQRGITAYSGVVGLAVDPSNPDRVVARTGTRIYASSDSGRSWTESKTPGGSADWTKCSLSYDANGTFVYACNVFGSVLRSRDRGASFTVVAGAPDLWSIAAAPTKPLRVYGVNPGVRVSEDGGYVWKEIAGVPSWCWTLAVSPVDPQVVYVSSTDTVYHLVTDVASGARSFVAAETPPQGIIRYLCADPRDPKRAVATHQRGMWLTEDGGKTWTHLADGNFSLPYMRAAEPGKILVSKDSGFYAWSAGTMTLLRENMRVTAYAEVKDGILLGTEMGLHLLRWQ